MQIFENRRAPALVSELKRYFESAELSPVSPQLRGVLEANGNSSTDWDRVLVSPGFTGRMVRNCELEKVRIVGEVTLSTSRIADSAIGEHAVIRSCSFISRQLIGPGAHIEATRLEHESAGPFGNDIEVSLGIEHSPVATPLAAEIDTGALCRLAENGFLATLPDDMRRLLHEYRDSLRSDFGVIGRDAEILTAGTVRSSLIDANVRVDGSVLIEESTIVSSDDESTRIGAGAILRRALVQPGASVTDGARVSRSLIGAKARVCDGATVSESVIGARSVIARGEVLCTLIGPLVNMNHNALLIACLWPAGHGTVGSGAQVGSNHTSRLPDQTLIAGEGLFFGLAVAIKFPANYAESPYSVIATGLITGPQRLRFPFSLISILDDPPADAPTGYNRLIPGWMFSHNLFAVLRSERKHATRMGVAVSQTRAIREQTLALVRDALARLESVGQPGEWYDDGQIAGVGKNVLLEVDRKRGIAAYRELLDYGEMRLALDGGSPIDEATRNRYLELIERLKMRTRDSRARDHHRGGRIFDDYHLHHPHPDDDPELEAVISILEDEEERLRRT